MRLFAVAAFATFAASVTACISQPTSAALVQQTAHEFNVNARFGRLDLAAETVSPTYREAFTKVHRAWGGDVRIGDTELAGVSLKGKDVAFVGVKVSWYRVDSTELRTTTVRQEWHDHKGTWLLEREERESGDFGLMGDRVEVVAPSGSAPRAQFPTVRIGAP